MTAKAKADTTKIVAGVDAKQSLNAKRWELQTQYEQALEKRSLARIELGAARERLESYTRGREDTADQTKVAELRQQLEDAKAAERAADDEIERIHGEIIDTDAEREKSAGWRTDDILALQRSIGEARARVDTLEAALEKHRQQLASYAGPSSRVPALLREREDLLSEIALGSAKKADLTTLDREIEEQRKAEAAKNEELGVKRQEAQHTIAGLERKLETACQELKKLVDSHEPVLFDVLRGRAEDLQREYLEHAQQIVDTYQRIRAIEIIARKLRPDHRPNADMIVRREFEPLSLPDMGLSGQERTDWFTRLGCIFASDTAQVYNLPTGTVGKTAQEMEDALTEAGVELSVK